MRGATDEIEPALAQLFVGLRHRIEQLERGARQEAHLDRRDGGEIRGRNEIGNGDAEAHCGFIPATATASFHSLRSSAMACWNCAGVLHIASTPILSSRA